MTGAVDLLAFAGVMALGQFSPGPDMILLTRTALKSGARAGAEMALGIATGLVFHSAVAFAGLALAFQRNPLLAEILRWGAAAYLLWISYRMVREHWFGSSTAVNEEMEVTPSTGRPFMRGLACNLLNPKAALFLAAVSAPFLRGSHPGWWPFALGGIVVVQGGALWALWARLLQWKPLSVRYRKLERWIDGIFAMVLVTLALVLIFG
ncbi:MAG: LysE family translocator [Luteolibacter sp.]|uniref:LysE family translocator n=1 Tax=Luteolibacter sp. TaxID=1962973 RepID=UPI003267D256